MIRSNHSKQKNKEPFYKKATLKNFSIFTGKHLENTLFNQVTCLQVCNSVKTRFQRRCFSVNIAKFLITPTLKKACERLLLNNVEPNFSSIYEGCKLAVLINVSQYSQENVSDGMSFLINIVVGM